MQNIKFGSGSFSLYDMNDNTILHLDKGIIEIEDFTEDKCNIAVHRKEIQALIAGEATLELKDVKIHRQLWYRLAYGNPWQWPVSNNWLKSHGYDMRRRRQIRKAFLWMWNKYMRGKSLWT